MEIFITLLLDHSIGEMWYCTAIWTIVLESCVSIKKFSLLNFVSFFFCYTFLPLKLAAMLKTMCVFVYTVLRRSLSVYHSF